MRWKPGSQIVQYEMLGKGIGLARPVTVVDDGPGHIALYSHPCTPMVTRGVDDYRSLGLSERIDLRTRMLDPGVGEFREVTTPDNHVLTLTQQDAWHSVMLFWSSEWQFKMWYVNLQSPISRVRRGVQSHDLALDIVVQPDMSWSWKDDGEFEALASQGFLSVDEVSSIRAEAARMARRIENLEPPFCDGWENWRPDPSWAVPQLPDDWSDLGSLESDHSEPPDRKE